ncbi:MAG: EVE domain-containing protein [Propionibacteriaceae bacterium]|nr:EVE domain-containing protein [Propionibacteriaceae bacterium]
MTKNPQESRERLDWINTISLNHVVRGVAGGFTQADHGRSTRLARLQAGDRIAFYSPRTDYPDGEPLQQFTAIGVVTGTGVYQVELAPDFHPWRREVRFEPCVPVPIRGLLDELGFIPDATHWGMPFRRGLFGIPADDFDRIATAMGATGLVTARAA